MISEGKFDSVALSAIMGEVFGKAGKTPLVLSVSDRTSEKLISFESTSVTLLSLGPRKQALLGDILVKSRRITSEQLKECLDEQRKTKEYLGNILTARAFITTDEIRAVVVDQLYEEIFDLITWENATYRFEDAEMPSSYNDPTLRMTKIEINPNLLSVEIGRSLEHWEQIRSEIPGEFEVPARVGKTSPDDIADIDDFSRRMLREIDGVTPISGLASRTGLSLFRTYLCYDTLKYYNLLRLLSSKEIRAASATNPTGSAAQDWHLEDCAEHVERRETIESSVGSLNNVFVKVEDIPEEAKVSFQREDPSGAILLYADGQHNVKSIADMSGTQELDLCRVLGKWLRDGLIRPATVSELKLSASDLQVTGNLDKAFSMLRWAFVLDNKDTELIQDIAIVTAAQGNRRYAAVFYKKIAEIARQSQDFDQAIIALGRVAELSPESYEVNTILAAIYLVRGEEYREQALTEFGQAIAKLILCGLIDQSRKIIDELLELSPNDEELRAQLMDLSIKVDPAFATLEGKCPSCKTNVGPEERECHACSAQLFHSCMTCGTDLKIGTFICPKCGKDPYGLPSKGQKGYTMKLKRAEGSSGFVRFKLFDAIAKARQAASDKRFTQAVASIKEAQKLQPYNEALKTEMEAIQKLAAEHEKDRPKQQDTPTPSYAKQVAKRFIALGAVAVLLIAAAGIVLYFYVNSNSDQKELDLLMSQVEVYIRNASPTALQDAENKLNGFIEKYPSGAASEQARGKIKAIRSKYDSLTEGLWSKIEPYVKDCEGKKPADIRATLTKSDMPRISEALRNVSAFLEEFPLSSRKAQVARLKITLTAVEEALKTDESSEAVEKRAQAKLDDLMQKAAASGFPSVIPDLQKLMADFPGTTAASNAKQRLGEYDGFLKTLAAFSAEIQALVSSGKYSDAEKKLAAFKVAYEGLPEAEGLKTSAARIAAKKTEFAALLRDLDRKWDNGALAVEDYMMVIQTRMDEYKDSGWAAELEDRLSDVRNRIADGERVLIRAQEELKNGNYQQVFLWHKRLVETYRKELGTKLDSLVLYVRINTNPQGAEVLALRGTALEKIGQSPCVAPVPYVSGKGSVVLVFRKRGFAESKLTIPAASVIANTDFNYPTFDLVATYSEKWTFGVEASIPPVLIPVGDKQLVATVEDLSISLLDTATGIRNKITLVTPARERPMLDDPSRTAPAELSYWRLRIQPEMVRLEGDKFFGDFLAVPATDGRIYLVDPVERKLKGDFGIAVKYPIVGRPAFRRVPLLMNKVFAYFVAANGQVFCCDPQTNTIRWSYKTGKTIEQSNGIYLEAGEKHLYVFIPNSKVIVLDYIGNALDGQGTKLAEFPCDRGCYSDGFIYLLDRGNIIVRDVSDKDFAVKQTVNTGLTIEAAIDVTPGGVLAYDGNMGRIFFLAGGDLKGKYEFKCQMVSMPSASELWCVVCLSDGRIMILNPADGKLIREIPTESGWVGRPVIAGDFIYLWDIDNTLYIIDARTNRQTWKNSDVREQVLCIIPRGKGLFVATRLALYFFEEVMRD